MIHITQSLIKALNDYILGEECGIRIQYQYEDGGMFEPTEAQAVGIYFEYKAFGTLPKSGKIPVPKWKNRKNNKRTQTIDTSELQKKYEVAVIQAEKLRSAMDYYGLKLLKAGEKITTVLDDGTIAEGTLDLILETTKPLPLFNRDTQKIERYLPEGMMIFGDTKSSGLMGDKGKWSDYGWHPDFLEQKDRLMIQPVHYVMIGTRHFKVDEIPWIFFVASQTNIVEQMWVHITVDPQKLEDHVETVKNARKLFERESRKGWKAKPELKRCADCGLFNNCTERMDVPYIIDKYY